MIGTTIDKQRPALVSRSVVRRDMAGASLGEIDLPPAYFGVEPNEAVVHQVVTAQLAAARAGTQSTKTRAEVRGGGAKPYRQKGTGRARQGSTRSPIWSGGGVALGPKPRSYRQRTPKKMVHLALVSALSARAASERVAVVDAWRFAVPRTKDAVGALGALGVEGKVLVVLGPDDHTAERSFGNLPEVQTVFAGELSAYDVVRNDWVVFTDATLPGAERADAAAPGPVTAEAAPHEAAADDEGTVGDGDAAEDDAAADAAADDDAAADAAADDDAAADAAADDEGAQR